MSHKPRKMLFTFWVHSLAVAIVTLFTLATNSNAQDTLQPYAPPILHTFLDSANVYPESVTVDQSSGIFKIMSVKQRAESLTRNIPAITEVFACSCIHPKYIHQLKRLVDDSFHQPLLDSAPFQRDQFL